MAFKIISRPTDRNKVIECRFLLEFLPFAAIVDRRLLIRRGDGWKLLTPKGSETCSFIAFKKALIADRMICPYEIPCSIREIDCPSGLSNGTVVRSKICATADTSEQTHAILRRYKRPSLKIA